MELGVASARGTKRVKSRVRGGGGGMWGGKILKKDAISCSLRPIAALFHANLNLNFYIFFNTD